MGIKCRTSYTLRNVGALPVERYPSGPFDNLTKVWLGEEGNLSFCSKAKRIHRRALSGCFDAIGEHAEREVRMETEWGLLSKPLGRAGDEGRE